MHKILFIGTTMYSFPLNPSLRKKFEGLATLGTVSVIGYVAEGSARVEHDVVKFYCAPRRAAHWSRRLSFVLHVIRSLRVVLRDGIDVIITQNPVEGAIAAFVLSCIRPFQKKPKLIVEIHGEWYRAPLLYHNENTLFRRAALNLINRYALLHADAFRVVSLFLEYELRRRHRAGARPVFRFAAYTDVELFLSAEPRFEMPSVIFVGQLTPLKGVQYLIEAMAHVPNMSLIVVGDGDYRKELEALVLREGIFDRCRFLGRCTPPRVKEFLEEATVLVLPSITEGLGLVLIEAQAAGIPVIGSAVGGVPEALQDTVTGFLVPPRDVGRLTEAIIKITSDLITARVMGECGRRFVHEHFGTARYINSYQTMIAKVCAE